MKELEHIETPEITIEQNIPKKVVFIGNMDKIKGLTMWEFSLVAVTLKEATYKESKTELIRSTLPHFLPQMKYGTVHTLETKESCIYVQALNKRNAFKKLAKAGHLNKLLKK